MSRIPTRTLSSLIDSRIIDAVTGFPCGGHNQTGDGIPHIRPFNVETDGSINLAQTKSISIEAAKGKPVITDRSVVFNNTNSLDLVGKCALWTDDSQPVFSNHMTRIRVLTDECDSAFLSYALLHHWQIGRSRMLARAHVAQASIMGARFLEIEVPWPCVDEQRGIAAVMDAVSQARQLHGRQAETAEALKRATMRELFTRGLRGEAQKDTEFGPVPADWSVLPLDEVADVQTGAAKGRNLGGSVIVEVPYLRVANVQDGHLDLTEMKKIRIRSTEVERYRLHVGDVVLTEGRDFDKLGRGFIWNGEIDLCVHQNHVFAVRLHPNRLLPKFFAYQSQSAYGKAYFLKVAHKTTNLACLNSTKLKAFPALVPHDLAEQREIVEILDAIDQKIDLHKRKRAVLEELFKALLHKLMTGEVRVSDLDLSALVSSGK